MNVNPDEVIEEVLDVIATVYPTPADLIDEMQLHWRLRKELEVAIANLFEDEDEEFRPKPATPKVLDRKVKAALPQHRRDNQRRAFV